MACRGTNCRVDVDDPQDRKKRNDLVTPIDEILRSDPWFSRRRRGGRLQHNRVVFFEIAEP